MTRVLVLGRSGQLARALAASAWPAGWAVGFSSRETLDLRRPEAIGPYLATVAPDVVINTAAYTAVDMAESDEAAAFALNAEAPGALAECCRADGRLLVHLSTDYVFPGSHGAPYGEEDPVGPLNVYGRSKAEGERRVLAADPDAQIARTAWLLSPDSGFVQAILTRALQGRPLTVVSDQQGNPTRAGDLADGLIRIAACRLGGTGQGGLLHVAGTGHASWFDLARTLVEASGLSTRDVQAIDSQSYNSAAARPLDSRLDVTHLQSAYGIALAPWTAWITEMAQLGHIRAKMGVETRQQSGA